MLAGIYTTNSGKQIPFPKDEIPIPPRAILFAVPGTDPVRYLHRKVERPGYCFWCLGEWHPDSDCILKNFCRCCKGFLPDMFNKGKKHACQFNMEAAPTCIFSDKGKGKGKGKGGPPADTSEAFKAHKLAQQKKRDNFKRKMEEQREVRNKKKPKSG